MEFDFGGGNSAQISNDDKIQLQLIRQRFSTARTSPCDLQFEREDGRVLNAFVHSDRAWLLFRYDKGDAGFSTRDPDYVGPEDAMLTYTLENGQQDEYPTSWTIPIEEAIRVVQYFSRTGDKATWLLWHNDQNWI